MAKKKTKKQEPKISPEKYIKTKARNLPIAECLISRDWKEAGIATAFVARQHASGNFTLGFFLVDLYCLGVKDCFYRYNLSPGEFDEVKQSGMDLVPISYEEIHNIIFGAIAYAEELGIAPHRAFDMVQYLLEEDTDDIPLIEYEYGYRGKPMLSVYSRREAMKYIPILEESVGKDFTCLVEGDEWLYDEDYDDDEDYDYPYDDEDYDDDCDWETIPQTKYSYIHPEYPKTLNLKHNEELQPLFSPDNSNRLKVEDIDRILSLPHDTLIEDLNHLILFEIGRGCEGITKEMMDEPANAIIMHALFFLGELKAEQSLDVLLEIMRQNEDFQEFHFGDATADILPLSLYYTGRNQLPKLLEYTKEPGLNVFFKSFVFAALTIVAVFEPDRRGEVIDWYRQVFDFYLSKTDDPDYFDGTLVGMMICELLDIKAVELLPEIERIYATGLVDLLCGGDCGTTVSAMKSDTSVNPYDYKEMDIYERYDCIDKKWML